MYEGVFRARGLGHVARIERREIRGGRCCRIRRLRHAVPPFPDFAALNPGYMTAG
jgi:hypothetical protein